MSSARLCTCWKAVGASVLLLRDAAASAAAEASAMPPPLISPPMPEAGGGQADCRSGGGSARSKGCGWSGTPLMSTTGNPPPSSGAPWRGAPANVGRGRGGGASMAVGGARRLCGVARGPGPAASGPGLARRAAAEEPGDPPGSVLGPSAKLQVSLVPGAHQSPSRSRSWPSCRSRSESKRVFAASCCSLASSSCRRPWNC
mmetsp:Transcript_136061/g.379226  ORF Transcript_136061/g.379226 Transcript_136061/m.379226 type:complete len:201 (+) Transcript_136061:649-1251(+)